MPHDTICFPKAMNAEKLAGMNAEKKRIEGIDSQEDRFAVCAACTKLWDGRAGLLV